MTVSRRHFLRGAAAGAAGTALTGGVLAGGARADTGNTANPAPPGVYPFHGTNQAGILTPTPAAKQNFVTLAAFDLVGGTTKSDLVDLMRTLTTRARLLTGGGALPTLGVGQPPADSAVLGPDMPADGLTATLGVGASLFDHRYGLSAVKPRRLAPMPNFPNDALEDSWLHGDLSLQLCAHQPDSVHHALRDITRHTRGAMQLRWKIDGYNSPPRPSGASRNLLGFKDGTANPTGNSATELVWVDDQDEPAWTEGGSYQVVRLIRMFVEFWDRVSINEQEKMFGRRRDSGAPLDGTTETDRPDYRADPDGTVIPLDAHIRLSNPRTPATDNQRLLRRSYNYDLGFDTNGNLQAGHLFVAYQQDLNRQFETIQNRLTDEPLTDYVQPFGGGYFYVLPGVTSSSDWYAQSLLA